MIADREIAELLCERVLGWTRAESRNQGYYGWSDALGKWHPMVLLDDWRTVGLVVEVLLTTHMLIFSKHNDVEYDASFGNFDAGYFGEVRDPNPVRAIALSALLAVGVTRAELGKP